MRNFSVKTDADELRELVTGMRAAYARGENAMALARQRAGADTNSAVATLVAYDLQAGSYVAATRAHPDYSVRWTSQLAELLGNFVRTGDTILEVGCGEATTLAGVLRRLPVAPRAASGFDLSWSRCAAGVDWLREQGVEATLFVADLFAIPFADRSVDVVYTSHSLEPNGGREEAALRELLRVARRAVVLVEPIYELASPDAQARMRSHGYVRGLKEAAERLGAAVADFRLLPCCANPLNPSGVVAIRKMDADESAPGETGSGAWQCPLTGARIEDRGDAFFGVETGIAYPVLRGIPLLRSEHAVVASRLNVRTEQTAGHSSS